MPSFFSRLFPPSNHVFQLIVKFAKTLTVLALLVAVFAVISILGDIILLGVMGHMVSPDEIPVPLKDMLFIPAIVCLLAAIADLVCAGVGFWGVRKDSKALVITYLVLLILTPLWIGAAAFLLLPCVLFGGGFAWIVAIFTSARGNQFFFAFICMLHVYQYS